MIDRVHIPVLVRETIDQLGINPSGVYIDATAGTGGHSLEILEHLNPAGKLIVIDRDSETIPILKERLRQHSDRVSIYNDNFTNLSNILGNNQIDGILFDLGISSLQLSTAPRGFSFMQEGDLDMRMTPMGNSLTAKFVINNFTKEQLTDIFQQYGEEKYAKQIASRIVKLRNIKSIKTSLELADIIAKTVPRRGKIHPATKIFQALRIYVNNELGNLTQGLEISITKLLKSGGRIVVISYHSLEDRIVKHTFKDYAQKGTINILTRKPIGPMAEEIKYNPHSRSAKLRSAEKL